MIAILKDAAQKCKGNSKKKMDHQDSDQKHHQLGWKEHFLHRNR